MEKHQHFIIHKPYGYLSQFVNNQNRRKNKKLLGELASFPDNTMSIGRLDENSEGLLFLTTDGLMSELVRGKKTEKEYFVQVDGKISDEAILKLTQGVEIRIQSGMYQTLPCPAKKLVANPGFAERSRKVRDDRHGPTSWISITLREGKFRQVRKMTAAVGFPTLRLVRVRIGNVLLQNMASGEVQEVNQFDI
jgi:23S rRNA pseudouridine2457 synthase